jgi:disulfide bond formation protein DsbB
LGSALILAGAYAFEIFGNYPPCPLCIEQRWVHIWIIIAGVAGFAAAQLLRRPDAQLVKTGAEAMRGWFRTRLQALYALYQAPGALARSPASSWRCCLAGAPMRPAAMPAWSMASGISTARRSTA